VENTSLPRLSTEEAKTSVMIKDGDTLVIGGLIKDKVTDIKKKIPFLGDIPLLGLAFRKTEKTIAKTDLIIFLTPHIITPEQPE
jgi:type IV pilus assembly protein PilQ